MKIDLSHIQDITELHLLFKSKLDFPDFYGMNWDAFWDSITGLVEMPDELILMGWKDFKAKFPHDSKILEEIVSDFNNEIGKKKIRIEWEE